MSSLLLAIKVGGYVMANLKDSFTKALQDANSVAPNFYINSLRNDVIEFSDVLQANQTDPVLDKYNQKLLEILSSKNIFSLDEEKTNEFVQLFGEAQFYLFCKKRGINLEKIKECNKKTPDFKHQGMDMFFEVKTLSIVSGETGIKKHLEDSLNTQITIEKQIKAGKKVALGETVIAPYGEKPYQKDKGPITAVIETLIEKTKNNLKEGQYPNKEQFPNRVNFLVLNLIMIPPSRTENFVLRPAYCDDFMFQKCISGDLWMVAFARPGIQVLGTPEFEGKPCIESIIDRYGVLVDPDIDFIDGLLFMIHPWQRPTEIWGLFLYDKYQSWNDKNPDIINTLISIVDNNWNDDKDLNGFNLNGQ